jgi:serine/threonine protein kinase
LFYSVLYILCRDATYVKKNGQKLEVILVVLELATGGELFDFLAFTGNFEESMARTYFHQLINGVGYCHSKGIAHRDLKPENLLLSSNFTLKLADFGFSNAFSNTERTMYTECGTPGYMAPEVFTRQGYDGIGADIW